MCFFAVSNKFATLMDIFYQTTAAEDLDRETVTQTEIASMPITIRTIEPIEKTHDPIEGKIDNFCQ